jgi:hypothetical protein
MGTSSGCTCYVRNVVIMSSCPLLGESGVHKDRSTSPSDLESFRLGEGKLWSTFSCPKGVVHWCE